MAWLGLVIGNSRLHWGYFQQGTLVQRWDTNHLLRDLSELPPDLKAYLSDWEEGVGCGVWGVGKETSFISDGATCGMRTDLPIYAASVVPAQTQLLERLLQPQWITLESIPLQNLYPTLGSDRALALLGAAEKYGIPCLVIDAGTALTFTGVDGNRSLVGGAILPGLKLQFQTLSRGTAALPETIIPQQLPPRWARDTEQAIASGILYSILAGIVDFLEDWWRQFPHSQVILTGGDGERLHQFLRTQYPELVPSLEIDADLVFLGIAGWFRSQLWL